MNLNRLYFIPIALFLIILNGCSKKEEIVPTIALIKETAIKALNGDTTANALLGNIINQKVVNNAKYSRIESDTIFANEENVYIDLLIENPYSFSNKYAVYDKDFRLLLYDQSLHGKIDKDVIKKNKLYFVLINENFIANDSIRVKRTSLYKVTPTSIALVYKNYFYLETAGISYTQKITFIDEEIIKTEIYVNNRLVDVDEFTFNKSKFISEKNKFETLIYSVYQPDFSNASENIQVEKSLLDEISLNLTENWSKVDSESDVESDNLESIKFVNPMIQAKLSIVKLGFKTNTESAIGVKLKNTMESNYTVKFSDILTDKEDRFVFQYFEFTSRAKKFLMMLTVPKENYDLYKDEFLGMAASFTIKN